MHADRLATTADRDRQPGDILRHQDEDGVAGRLLEVLEQRVGRIDVHGVGRIDNGHLARAQAGGQRQALDQRPYCIHGNLGFTRLRGQPEAVGMGPAGPQLTRPALAAGAARARLNAQQPSGHGIGECRLARAERSRNQQRVRQPARFQLGFECLPVLFQPGQRDHGTWRSSTARI